MGKLALVVQEENEDPSRRLNKLGERVATLVADRINDLFFVRTGSELQLSSTSSIQACFRSTSFENGRTKVRILLNEPVRESFAGMATLLDEIFAKNPNAVIVLVHGKEYCAGLFSHLIDPCNPAEFDWSAGKAVIITRHIHYFRAAAQF